ncbi:MAG: DUF2282 domain-containing protein [Pseudomonadota bacterium]|nr:DUF2282 domain-containing protein [Pseudomonadota bacterium]
MKSAKILTAAIAAAVGVGLCASQGAKAAPPAMEKCYGVAKAEKNDCGTSLHACAGLAKTDCIFDEWVLMPKGLCEKLAYGSLKPVKTHKHK